MTIYDEMRDVVRAWLRDHPDQEFVSAREIALVYTGYWNPKTLRPKNQRKNTDLNPYSPYIAAATRALKELGYVRYSSGRRSAWFWKPTMTGKVSVEVEG